MALRKLSHIEDDAVEWLREKYDRLRHSLIIGRVGSLRNPYSIISEGNKEKTLKLGRMYFFHYQPKLKEHLPYYDIFPLVIPIKPYAKGVLGMNFHYLPYSLREVLMKKLVGFLSEEDLEAYLNISYNDIKGFTRFKEAKPTLHKYDLTPGAYVRSQFIHIEPNEWTTALHLPVEEFRSRGGGTGVTKARVWGDSKDIIEHHSIKFI
jgi:hypothetical protein